MKVCTLNCTVYGTVNIFDFNVKFIILQLNKNSRLERKGVLKRDTDDRQRRAKKNRTSET